jgi:hypothetical protein
MWRTHGIQGNSTAPLVLLTPSSLDLFFQNVRLLLRYSLCGGAVKEHCFPFRPGCCAKHGLAEAYKTSIDFPDETLSFIKSHPLMDSAVPPIADEPWFTKTRVRWDCVGKQWPVLIPVLLWLASPSDLPHLLWQVQIDSHCRGPFCRALPELHSHLCWLWSWRGT